jgi:hypothetical protein
MDKLLAPVPEPRREPLVVHQGEPAEGRAAAVREAGRRITDFYPLRAAAREAEGVVADRYQSARPTLGAGRDPWAEHGWRRGGSSPVGADLVDVEVVGVEHRWLETSLRRSIGREDQPPEAITRTNLLPLLLLSPSLSSSSSSSSYCIERSGES